MKKRFFFILERYDDLIWKVESLNVSARVNIPLKLNAQSYYPLLQDKKSRFFNCTNLIADSLGLTMVTKNANNKHFKC